MATGKPDVLFVNPLYNYPLEEVAGIFENHKYWEADDKDALLASLSSACRAAVTRSTFSSEMMDKLPNLGIIAVCGVGYDGVDDEAARQRGIAVTNTPDVLTEDVADYALALLLAVARLIPQGERYLREGRWKREGPMRYGRRVHGGKLGVLGLGRIGSSLARRCEALSMCIGYHNRNQREDVAYQYFDSAEALALWSDFLVVVTPGGDSTLRLVNAEVLDALGPDGILINVGRGSTVDDDALAAALSEGRIAGAGLDVFVDEPNVPEAFLGLEDKLVLQPHQASATHDTRRAMSRLCIDNVSAFLDGRELLSPVP